MKGNIEAAILLPRHLIMNWKSCSGLDIIEDTFAMPNLPLSSAQLVKLQIGERSLNLQAC